MRVTLDTNIFVSALQFGGLPAKLLDLHTDEHFELCISPVIVAELRGVLLDRFAWSTEDMDAVLQPILSRAVMVHPTTVVIASADPDDDHILACAVDGKSDAVVSGDNDLLRLGMVEGIPIITARQFFDRLAAP